MNGPEHYAEAERLLALAGGGGELVANVGVPVAAGDLIAAAGAHATLAAAAATIELADVMSSSAQADDFHARRRVEVDPVWMEVVWS